MNPLLRLLAPPQASPKARASQVSIRLASLLFLAFSPTHCSIEYAPAIRPHATVIMGYQEMDFYPPVQGGTSPDAPPVAQLGSMLGVQPGGSNRLTMQLYLSMVLDARAYRTAQMLVDDTSFSLERAADGETLAALMLGGQQSPVPLDSGATIEEPALVGATVDDALREQLCAGLALRVHASVLDSSTGDRITAESAPFVVACPPRHATATIEVIDAYLLLADPPEGIPDDLGATTGELHAVFSEHFSLGHEETRRISHNGFNAVPAAATLPLDHSFAPLVSSANELSFSREPTTLEGDSTATTGVLWTAQILDLRQMPWLCTGPTQFSTIVAFSLPSDSPQPPENLYPYYPLNAPPVNIRCIHQAP